jgi:hypothetical protein
MEKKEERKEGKDVKVRIQLSLPSLLNYLAIAAAVLGLLYAILSTVGMEASGSSRAGQFFLGMLYAVVASGFLAGFSELISSRKH